MKWDVAQHRKLAGENIWCLFSMLGRLSQQVPAAVTSVNSDCVKFEPKDSFSVTSSRNPEMLVQNPLGEESKKEGSTAVSETLASVGLWSYMEVKGESFNTLWCCPSTKMRGPIERVALTHNKDANV